MRPTTEAGRALARCVYDGTGPADDEVREVEQQAAAAERRRLRERFEQWLYDQGAAKALLLVDVEMCMDDLLADPAP